MHREKGALPVFLPVQFETDIEIGMRQIKNSSKPTDARPRPWWRLGPGVIIALLAGAAFLYGQSAPPDNPNAGRIAYEADANGHLQRVSRPTMQPGAVVTLPPLWKPETGFLVRYAGDLGLTMDQQTSARKLDTLWSQEKTALCRRLGESSQDTNALLKRADPEKRASLSLVTTSLNDYAQLSEEYDRRRNGYWIQAVAVLNPGQRQRLDHLRQAGKR